MASTAIRRPLPALIALLALLLLTALVWWRVLHRTSSSDAAGVRPTCPATTSATTVKAVLPAPSTVTLVVFNATNRNGIAGKARTALTADGFKIPAPAANASRKTHVTGIAEIRYGPSAKKAATLVRYYFPGSVLRATPATSSTVAVILGNRYRGVATAAAVKTALAGDHVAVAPTATPAPATGSASC